MVKQLKWSDWVGDLSQWLIEVIFKINKNKKNKKSSSENNFLH